MIEKILFISQTALGSSPTNRYLELLAPIVKKNIEVTLFFIGKGKEITDEKIKYPKSMNGIRLIHSPAIPKFLLTSHTFGTSLLTGFYLLITALPKLFLLARHYDIIHLGKPLPFGAFLCLLLRIGLKKPFIVDFDDWEGVGGFATIKQRENAFSKTIITFFEEYLPLKCNAVVVVSKLLVEKMKMMNISDTAIHYIPNGADIQRYRPQITGEKIRNELHIPTSDKVLVYLGTFKPGGANWKLILDIFTNVQQEINNTKLVLIGYGSDLTNAKTYAHTLGLDHCVIFTGKVENANVPEHLAIADVFILPYSIDFPNTYINIGRSSLKLYEYMAMGKSIVASNIGELHESLKDGGGILVPDNDPQTFAKSIITLLNNPDHRKKLGNEARLRAEKIYNYDTLSDRLYALYKSFDSIS